jgi:hypothetical protein
MSKTFYFINPKLKSRNDTTYAKSPILISKINTVNLVIKQKPSLKQIYFSKKKRANNQNHHKPTKQKPSNQNKT